MGRIKITAVKNLAEELIKEHGGKFKDDFEHNKKVLTEIKPMKSKKIMNQTAGYITRVMKRLKKTGL